jgi:DNA polymerase elongation subunit (family B)
MCTEIIKREVRFSWHLPKTTYRDEDLHYVRLDETCKCGKVHPKTTYIKDYKGDVWVTKPVHRSHRDKKEFEHKEFLFDQKTTQSDMFRTAAAMLGSPHLASSPDQLKSSPYVYMLDVTSTSLIKLGSLQKNNFVQSSYSVAAFDIETNPLTDEILMATITYGNRSYTAVQSKFLKNIADPVRRLKLGIEKYLPKYKDLDFELKLHTCELDLLKDIFRIANEWKPVFLTVWNLDFDISKTLDAIKRANAYPTDVICDQSIPRHLRVCKYRQGLKKKVTASGVVKPINPSLQWHTLIATTPFYMIDSMCVYRQLRMAKQEKPSYSLDAILQDELGSRKLQFEEAEEYKGVNWHLFMQENYPIEYIVYNIYDCLGVLELETKNRDLSNSLPSFAGITDFQKFNSQVRKVTDAVFLFGLERDMIIGTVGRINKPEEALDDTPDDVLGDTDEVDTTTYKTLDLKGWIQLLPQNLLIHNGLKCLEDYPDVVTNIRGVSVDLDCSSAYPSATLTANVSKTTCVNELISVDGIPEPVFRTQNLGICLGPANMLEYASVMFSLPSLDTIDHYLDEIDSVV